MPAPTSGLLSKLIPWKPPHALGESRLHLVQLKDPKERVKLVGPLVATEEKASMPVFGPEKFTSKYSQSNLTAAVKQSLQWNNDLVANRLDSIELKNSPKLGDPVGETLGDLLAHLRFPKGEKSQVEDEHGAHSKLQSSLELHDNITASTEDQLDSKMLRRAKLGYLFDCKTNILIVKDDARLQSVWEWIHGAQGAAKHDGMVAGSLDLSYLGVYSVWMNSLGEKSKSRLIDSTIIPDASQWEHLISSINKRADRPTFNGVETSKPQHRQLCLAICGLVRTTAELDRDLKALEEEGRHTTAAAWALFEGFPKRAVEILKKGRTDLLFIAMALDIKLNSSSAVIDAGEWSEALEDHPQMAEDPYLRAIYGYITSGNWEAIANETALPLLDRVGLALRKFGDAQLTEWLSKQMEEAIRNGDIEGIVLAGITDHTADILAKYVEKFMEYQTATLIMSFCHPRYIDDARCKAWHKAYRDFLQRHKEYILRVKFEQQSNIKSRSRDGIPANRPPPRQVTIRCLKCDTMTANDLGNSGALPTSAPGPSSTMSDDRNQLAVTGGIAGLCCPKCGSHLGRCAICMEVVGVPRSDRPEQSNDPNIRRMANFPTFCLKCKHVTHMDHSVDWLSRHTECPVPECRCQCNQQ